MSTLLAPHMSGLLFSSTPTRIEKRDLARVKSVHIKGEAAPGWLVYDYVTDSPIPEVDAPPAEPPFQHGLLLRWGRNSLLALAHDYRIVQHLLKHELKPLKKWTPRLNEIRVHDLVLHMAGASSSPGREESDRPELGGDLTETLAEDTSIFRNFYTLSFVAGRTDGFGEDLRKMQFYGDRVSYASLFRYCIPLMRFYSCQLRHDRTDIVRLGKDGFIDFKLPSNESDRRDRLKEINKILRSLTDHGYIA